MDYTCLLLPNWKENNYLRKQGLLVNDYGIGTLDLYSDDSFRSIGVR